MLVALINYVFTTIIREESELRNRKAVAASIIRSAKIFAVAAESIFEILKKGRRLTQAALERLSQKLLELLNEAFDPNYKKRKSTLGRLLEA